MRNCLPFIRCGAMLLAALAWLTVTGHAATATATLDRDTVAVGESATLQLRIEGGVPQAAPNFPAQANLTIQYAGQGSQYAVINGRASQSLVLSYQVTPAQAGSYTIPSLRINTDNGAASTQPLKLTAGRDDATGAPAAFVRLAAAKTNVFVGELIPVEIKVYGVAIEELNQPVLKSDGFTVGAKAPHTGGREQIGNVIYTVYSFKMSVAAAKAGALALGPAESSMVIKIPLGGRRNAGADIFDEFFGGRYQRRSVVATSDPLTIQVSPLPNKNVPPGFNDALGNFQFGMKAAPTNVNMGDPITLQFQIQGRGSLDAVQLPALDWKDFTFYPPSSTVTNTDPLGLQGAKFFEQVIVPQRAGIASIPAVSFSFFDPDQRAYRTITQPPIAIQVAAVAQSTAQPTVVAPANGDAPNQPPPPATDIVHIKPDIGGYGLLAPPLAQRSWFLALNLLPMALWLAAWLRRKRADQLARDPARQRQRETARKIAEGLVILKSQADANNAEEFFATTFRLLQEQLGERLDLPAAAITEAVLEERLAKMKAPAELITQLHGLFQSCNQARYAGTPAAGQLEKLTSEISAALTAIQRLKKGDGK